MRGGSRGDSAQIIATHYAMELYSCSPEGQGRFCMVTNTFVWSVSILSLLLEKSRVLMLVVVKPSSRNHCLSAQDAWFKIKLQKHLPENPGSLTVLSQLISGGVRVCVKTEEENSILSE